MPDRFAYIDDFFKRFKLSNYIDSAFLDYFERLLKRGQIERAIQEYNRRVPYEVSGVYTKTIQDVFARTVDREIPPREIDNISVKIGLYTRKTIDVLVSSMRAFSTGFLNTFFTEHGLSNRKLQDIIKNATIGQYEQYIEGAMSQTPTYVLNAIRDIQREWIFRNQAIAKNYDVGELLEMSEREFRQMLRNKFPHIFKDIEDGKILKSRLYGENLDKVRSYTLAEYNDMATRATILNVDRQSCELSAHAAGERVVEYYVRDTRPVATQEREICQKILKKKIAGKSLIALDDETGAQLGIPTLTQAQQQGAMFIHCRHSIRRLDPEFLEQLEKVIFLQKQITERVS